MSETAFFEFTLPSEPNVPSAPACAMLPAGARRGVVVIHEILGRQPEIDRVVQRFAAAGYAAVAPDLLAAGPRVLCIWRAVQAIRTGQGPQIEQIYAARRWLCQQTGLAEGNVGLIGFCLGGGFALTAGKGWGAVSTNYGDLPPDEVLRGTAPVIGCYGGQDRVFGKMGAKLEAHLGRLGVEVETHTFPQVGHSFLTDGHHPVAQVLTRPFFHIRYDPQVAEEAWGHIFAFFGRHIDPRA